jgi:hypothetical protein
VVLVAVSYLPATLLCPCSGKTMLLKALAGQLRGSGGEGFNVSDGWGQTDL